MSAEEFMVKNCDDVAAASGGKTKCWVYRNGIKALPWHTSVRKLLEDKAQWGLFVPLKGCSPAPGEYVCGPDATQNLFHVRGPRRRAPRPLGRAGGRFNRSARALTAPPPPHPSQDFEQTPRGDCGVGIECGEYVFDHRNRCAGARGAPLAVRAPSRPFPAAFDSAPCATFSSASIFSRPPSPPPLRGTTSTTVSRLPFGQPAVGSARRSRPRAL